MGNIESVKIRRMGVSDIAPLACIETQGFARTWSAREFSHLIRESEALYLVAEVTDDKGAKKVSGIAGMRIVCGEGDIDNVAVLPEYRNHGIASLLVEELLKAGKEAGVEEFTLEVRVSNEAAIRVYEKAGFVSEGIRPGFYEDPKEDANIMWIRKKA